MRVLIISDLHANLTALQTVLDDAHGEWDFIWCLGDVVGYGPDPNECVDLLRSMPHLCLAGNHDWAALGRLDIRTFNSDARQAVTWTVDTLRPDNIEYLAALPTTFVLGAYTLAHGSPREPVWEYVLDPLIASLNLPYFETPYCLVGHTHTPIIFEMVNDQGDTEAFPPVYNKAQPLNDRRRIINPGSVGQPRDSNPQASYVLLDMENAVFEHRRVAYDIKDVQSRMRKFDLPERLIIRLDHGW
ncbi:metallophosphoesterase family protein [Chloroflexota bacterium]